ncbi:MAG: ectoine hydroxylase-related dioxygenase (phytanoyl-CoA dioxygenase family) [Planctomycetota bacterium]|jgi:ectoine hydroxylase-related dioxygenase (phytanoyl-CoA dioxygenase family)
MNSDALRPITPDELTSYQDDGVVLLPGLFDLEWIDLLDKGLSENCNNPTDRSRVWDRDAEGRTMFWDSQAWQGIDEYQQFIFDSPAAQIAGQLMQSTQINFYFDAVFIRSPGSQFVTPWHQDEPYWSVEGYDTCTLWMPLVPVKRENALAYLPGSHRLDSVFYQYNFGELNPDGKAVVDQVDFSGIAETALPDIDSDPEGFGVVSWDMQPGDCVAFNSRIIHGGSGKLHKDTDLRVFTSKWLGDDVHIKFRDCGMDPDHSAIMTENGLKPGDRPGTDLYPRVWSRS